VLLTKDRGILRRRAVTSGGHVRGQHVDVQLADVLDRFAPPLVPWTRCPQVVADARAHAGGQPDSGGPDSDRSGSWPDAGA
jgi:hypothetical protein